MSGFTTQFKVPAGTFADTTAYGGNAPPTVAQFALCEIIGLEPLIGKDKQPIAGAVKVNLRYPAEHNSYEDDVIINLPGRPGVDAESAKKDKRSLVTTLEALGYNKETIDGYEVNEAWFQPDANGPKFMSVIWQPGIAGLQGSYGKTWPISRERWQKAKAAGVDPAVMAPAARAPGGGVNQGGGGAYGGAAAAAPAPTISAPAPDTGAPTPTTGAPSPTPTTSAAPPATGMAAFAG